MQFKSTCLETVTYVLSDNVVTSTNLEERLAPLYQRLKLPEGRLELISGIRERRVWDPEVRPSTISAQAGQKAIDKIGLDVSEIDAIFHVSVCRDFMEPATSSVVHNLLKLPQTAMNFDISNACLGMMSGIQVAAAMIESGQIKRALLVSGENSGRLLAGTLHELLTNQNLTRKDLKNHFASLTIGSAGAAVILAHESIAKVKHKIIGGACQSHTEFNHLCQGGDVSGNAAGIQMQTNSELLLQEGIALAKRTWEHAEQELNWTEHTPAIFCCHQVGKTHRDHLFAAIGADVEKDFSIFEITGNCGSASWPMALAMAEEQGKIKEGDNVAMLGIGSGINCTMLGLKWGK